MHPLLLIVLIGLGCIGIFAGVTLAKPDEIAAALRRIANAMESVKKDKQARDVLSIEVLGDIKGLLAQLVSRTSHSPPPTMSTTPTASGPVLWELCYRHSNEWHHSGWVREGTDTYYKALATSGIAVRRGSHVDEGVQ